MRPTNVLKQKKKINCSNSLDDLEAPIKSYSITLYDFNASKIRVNNKNMSSTALVNRKARKSLSLNPLDC